MDNPDLRESLQRLKDELPIVVYELWVAIYKLESDIGDLKENQHGHEE